MAASKRNAKGPASVGPARPALGEPGITAEIVEEITVAAQRRLRQELCELFMRELLAEEGVTAKDAAYIRKTFMAIANDEPANEPKKKTKTKRGRAK